MDVATCQDALQQAGEALQHLQPVSRTTLTDHAAFAAELDGLLDACMPTLLQANSCARASCAGCHLSTSLMPRLTIWLKKITAILCAQPLLSKHPHNSARLSCFACTLCNWQKTSACFAMVLSVPAAR